MADDLSSLARDLGEIPKATAPFVRKAVEISARNIKDLIRDEYSGARALPGASRSISYDLHGSTGSRLGGISAEIGPELGGQGSVVGLVDEGAPRTPGRKRIPKALQNEAPGFTQGIERAIDDGLKAAGL
ncbi:hypothetical protein [Curtobacterium sp. MCLR17_034]|uniref:hypothetical protein n=1 Tax=Curtobacterium sp. MCLR17_034 TaxID=2175623 RepID=UPI0011B42400|nr:hypothetical protein [Curtobacterium sp. MCLR17_034]